MVVEGDEGVGSGNETRERDTDFAEQLVGIPERTYTQRITSFVCRTQDIIEPVTYVLVKWSVHWLYSTIFT